MDRNNKIDENQGMKDIYLHDNKLFFVSNNKLSVNHKNKQYDIVKMKLSISYIFNDQQIKKVYSSSISIAVKEP